MPEKFDAKTKANVIADILLGLTEGTPLAEMCRKHDLGVSTFYDWKYADEQLAGRIARAREIGFDVIAEGVLPIIDDVGEDPASRRVRAEYRLKLLAKWDPKRYGDMLKHGNADGSNIDLASMIDAARQRVANVE